MLSSSTGNHSPVDVQNQQQNSDQLHHGTAHGKELNAAAVEFVPSTGRAMPKPTRQLAGQHGQTDVSQHNVSHQEGRESGRGRAVRGTGRGKGRGGRLPSAGGLSQALGQHQEPVQYTNAPTLDGRQKGGQKQQPGSVQQPRQHRSPAGGARQKQRQRQHQHQRGEEELSGGGADVDGGGQSVLGRSPSGRSGYLSANHLLNFQPYDRQQAPGRAGLFARGRGGRGRRGRPRSLPYNRNKFLQANFRFMVSDASDLQRHQTDADLMLDWEDVLQVEMLAQGEVQCPISLDTAPLCPQITPCGHVFAFPSIMQHLITHGGEQLRKTSPCPLCYSQIAARELRMVRVYRVGRPEAGSTVTFQLLRRPRDSIIPSRVHSSKAEGSQEVKEGAAAGSSPPAGTASSGATSAAATWACRQGINGKDSTSGKGATASPRGVPASLFAKYTVVSKPEPLWQAAAAELAEHAAQVTAEGGTDAAQEAPYIYAALDALAARAAAWAEHRQRNLISAAPQGAADSMLLPEAVGRQAAEVVRQFSTAAVQTSSQQITAAAEQAHRMEEFPLLTGIPSPEAPAATPPGPRPQLQPLLRLASCSPDAQLPAGAMSHRQAGYQAAFTESEDECDPADIPASSDGVDPAEVVPDVGAGHPGPTTSMQGAAAVSRAVPAKQTTLKQDGHGDRQAAAAGSLTSDGGSAAAAGDSPVGGSFAPGEFYFYQAADGQWLFLHPMNVRMLLAHAGSYANCFPQIEAKVLELEELVQTEAVRKKLKHLDHLPATASFLLAEVDLSSVLPPAALEPFTAEVAARQQRRESKIEAEAARERHEAAAAVAAAARAGQKALSARELKAMPKPSREVAVASLSETEALNVAIAESLRQGSRSETGQSANGDASGDEGPSRQPPESGVSFARIASMGFAATGPSLGPAAAGLAARPAGASAWGAGGAAAQSAAPPGSSPGESSAWGANLAQQIQAAAEQSRRQVAGSEKDKKSKKGGKQMVVLGGSQRRY